MLGDSFVAPLGSATNIRFIGFNGSAEQRVALLKQGADLVEHAPCGLIRNAKLPLKLLRGDTAARARHEVDGVEPQLERGSGVLKDRSYERVLVVAAVLASVRGTVLLSVVLGNPLARRAVHAFGVELDYQIFKASAVIGELVHELHEGVSGLRGLRPFRLVAVYFGHTKSILEGSTAVKGISPLSSRCSGMQDSRTYRSTAYAIASRRLCSLAESIPRWYRK